MRVVPVSLDSLSVALYKRTVYPISKTPAAMDPDTSNDRHLPLGLRSAGLDFEELSQKERELIEQILINDFRFEPNRDKTLERYHLPFYSNHQLIRIGESNGPRRRDSYSIIQFENGQDGQASLIPLDGKAAPIHEINKGPGNLRLERSRSEGDPGFEEMQFHYLCFFCWAIHATEGNFAIVTSKEDLELVVNSVNDREEGLPEHQSQEEGHLKKKLQELDFGPQSEGNVWHAKVVYGKSLFESDFQVFETGMVKMLEDTECLSLPGKFNEGFDRGGLFSLSLSRPYPSRGVSQDEDALEPIEPSEFSAQWRRGDPDGFRIAEPVELDPDSEMTPMGLQRRIVSVTNCRFDSPIRLKSSRPDLQIRFVNCTFNQGVDLSGARIEGSLEFDDCLFSEDSSAPPIDRFLEPCINLQQAHIGGRLRFQRCGFAGRFFAPALRVGGNLSLLGCRIGTIIGEVVCPVTLSELVEWPERSFEDTVFLKLKRSAAQVAAMDLTGVMIGGDLELTTSDADSIHNYSNNEEYLESKIARTFDKLHRDLRHLVVTSIRGKCVLRDAKINGNLLLFGFACSSELTLKGLKAGAMSTVGSKFHQRIELQKHGSVWPFCSTATINGPIHLQGNSDFGSLLVRGDLAVENSTIEGDLDLLCTQIDGNLLLSSSNVTGWLRAIRHGSLVGDPTRPALEVHSDANLNGSHFGYAQFRGIEVGGLFSLSTSSAEVFEIGFGWQRTSYFEEDKHRHRPMFSKLGSIEIFGSRIENQLTLTGLRLLSAPCQKKPGFVAVKQTQVGGDLRFSPTKPLHEYLKQNLGETSWAELPAHSNHGMRRAIRQAGQTLEENQPSIVDYPSRIEGDLDLSANQIGGQLDLSNVWVEGGKLLLHHSNVGLDLRMSVQTSVGDDPIAYSRLTTRCTELNLEKITVGGNADLTGLRVSSSGGDVLARDVEIRGDLLLVPEEDTRKKLESDECGSVRVATEEDILRSSPPWGIAPLTIDDCSSILLILPPRWFAQIEGVLDLTAIQSGRLIMSGDNVKAPDKPVKIPRGRIGRFEILDPTPGPLDLTRTEVARWSVDDNQEPIAPDFAKVFEQLEPFDRATWVAVELRLRNEMRTGEANQLYRAMRRMNRRKRLEKDKKFLIEQTARDNDTINSSRGRHLTESAFAVLERLTRPLINDSKTREKKASGAGPNTRCPKTTQRLPEIWGEFILWLKDIAFSLSGWATVTFFRRSFFFWFKDSFSSLIGWGTLSWIPIALWLPLFLFFSILLSQPDNVEASPELLQRPDMAHHLETLLPKTITPALERISPSEINGVTWGGPDGALLAARYGIPVANFFAHDGWKASSTPAKLSQTQLCFSPEFFGNLLAAFGWIAWPLWLIGLARSSVRDRQI